MFFLTSTSTQFGCDIKATQSWFYSSMKTLVGREPIYIFMLTSSAMSSVVTEGDNWDELKWTLIMLHAYKTLE